MLVKKFMTTLRNLIFMWSVILHALASVLEPPNRELTYNEMEFISIMGGISCSICKTELKVFGNCTPTLINKFKKLFSKSDNSYNKLQDIVHKVCIIIRKYKNNKQMDKEESTYLYRSYFEILLEMPFLLQPSFVYSGYFIRVLRTMIVINEKLMVDILENVSQDIDPINRGIFYETVSTIYKNNSWNPITLYKSLHIDKYSLWQFTPIEVFKILAEQEPIFIKQGLDMIQERFHASFYEGFTHEKLLTSGKTLISLNFLKENLQKNEQSSLKILMNYLFYNSSRFKEADMVVLLNEAINENNQNAFSLICKFIRIINMEFTIESAINVGASYIKKHERFSALLIRDFIILGHLEKISTLENRERRIENELIKHVPNFPAQITIFLDLIKKRVFYTYKDKKYIETLINQISVIGNDLYTIPMDFCVYMSHFINIPTDLTPNHALSIVPESLEVLYKSVLVLNGQTFRFLCDFMTDSYHTISKEVAEIQKPSYHEPAYLLEAIISFLAKHDCLSNHLISIITVCVEKNMKEALNYIFYYIMHRPNLASIPIGTAINIIILFSKQKQYESVIMLERKFKQIPGYPGMILFSN